MPGSDFGCGIAPGTALSPARVTRKSLEPGSSDSEVDGPDSLTQADPAVLGLDPVYPAVRAGRAGPWSPAAGPEGPGGPEKMIRVENPEVPGSRLVPLWCRYSQLCRFKST